MRKGEATKIPGISRDGNAWIVRVRVKQGSLTLDKTKRIEGTQANAVVALEQLREEANRELGRKARGETHETLGVFAPLWLDSLRARGKTRAYADTRVKHLERFILPWLGHRAPTAIKPKDIESWKHWLVEQRTEDGKPYAHETLTTVWGTMRSFLRFVTVQADLPRNPAQDVRFDVRGRDRAEKDVLDADELQRLIAASEEESPDVRTMLVVGFGLGIRFSELSALQWSDIDLDGGRLRIQRSQVLGVVGPPKTESTRRDVYLPPEVVAELRVHKQRQEAGQEPTELVFPSRTGGYRLPQMLTKPLARCCARAGIDKHITAHCLRHTANNLLRQVANEVVVRAMIGHATPAMTLRYSHVGQDERARAHRAAFGDALRGRKD